MFQWEGWTDFWGIFCISVVGFGQHPIKGAEPSTVGDALIKNQDRPFKNILFSDSSHFRVKAHIFGCRKFFHTFVNHSGTSGFLSLVDRWVSAPHIYLYDYLLFFLIIGALKPQVKAVTLVFSIKLSELQFFVVLIMLGLGRMFQARGFQPITEMCNCKLHMQMAPKPGDKDMTKVKRPNEL